jgi:hypothetical protein
MRRARAAPDRHQQLPVEPHLMAGGKLLNPKFLKLLSTQTLIEGAACHMVTASFRQLRFDELTFCLR